MAGLRKILKMYGETKVTGSDGSSPRLSERDDGGIKRGHSAMNEEALKVFYARLAE